MSGQIDMFKSKTKKDKQNKDPKSHIQEHKEPKFKVYINAGEMKRIHEWVMEYPDIETGGDLFGLWVDNYKANVQFVLGPGKCCRRTITSFFQDVSYLADAGNYLTEQHGLCNIGQWHSHHSIPLFEPSAGDHNTVWRNLPILGMKRYIVLIANIEDGKPSVNCFLFEIQNGKQLPVEKGCFKELDGDSPFRLDSFIMENVRNGAESLNDNDKVCKPTEEISTQDENEISQTPEADTRNPEIGLSITPNIDDKHVSAGKKEIDDNGRENKKHTEIDDHDHQNTTNMIKTTEEQHVDNLSAVTEREDETNSGAAITEPKSSNHHTHPPNEISDIQQTTNTNTTKQNNDNNSNNSNNNNYNSNNNNITINNGMNNNKSETESKVNNASAETVHKEGNDQETEEVSTGHPTSSNDRSDPQHTTITNGEEKSQTSPSEESQELKVNNASAQSVHEEGNHAETEEVSTRQLRSSNDRNAITGQPKATNHSSDAQHTTTNEEEAKCTNLFCSIVLRLQNLWRQSF